MRGTIVLSLGIGWVAALGAEYLGAQSGLDCIIIYSEQFAYLDRMFVVALIFVFYAALSYAIFDRLSRLLLRWTPQAGRVVAHGWKGRPAGRRRWWRRRSEARVS